MEKSNNDLLLALAGGLLAANSGGVRILDPARMRGFLECERELKAVLGGSPGAVRADTGEVYDKGIGVIRVCAEQLDTRYCRLFAGALSRADNYEIYPRTDGRVMLALTFYGITRKVGN